MKQLSIFITLTVVLTIVHCQDASEDCIGTLSTLYRGTRNMTATGKICQRWDTDNPHKPKYTPRDGGNHNYCRNPDDDERGTWCYTAEPNTRWEYCNITKCDTKPPEPEGCPEDIELSLPDCAASLTYSWTAPTWKDNSTPSEKLVIAGPQESSGNFSAGRNIVTYTATDEAENTGYCKFEVIVPNNECFPPPSMKTNMKRTETFCGQRRGSYFTVTCKKPGEVIWINPETPTEHSVPGIEIRCNSNLLWVTEEKGFANSKCGPPDCIDDLGTSYRGTINKTTSGRLCQRWDTERPHKPRYTPPDGANHNYCRNPDNDVRGTWCYTIDPYTRWEYCNITKCESVSSTKEEISTTRKTTLSSQPSKAITEEQQECENDTFCFITVVRNTIKAIISIFGN